MGLHYIHAHGIIHCDVNPENVFLEEGAALQVRIGDFDVSQDKAKHATLAAEYARTRLTVLGFTSMYLAPEFMQASSPPFSEASDIYAAGLMFFDMLVGSDQERQPPPAVPELDKVGKQERALLKKWLHNDPRKRATIPEILASDFFMHAETALNQEMQRREAELRGEPRTCCICGDDFHQADGLDCPSQEPSHFVCAECLTGYVKSEAEKPLDQLQQSEGKVWCPLRRLEGGCDAKQPYEMSCLAARVDARAFQAQAAAIKQVIEQKLSQEMESHFKRQLKEEIERFEKLSALQRQVQQAKRYIQDELLTLKCPRPTCRIAFVDFDGCFALKLGDDAHRHVARCEATLEPGKAVYSTLSKFEQAHQSRRQLLVRDYLRSLGSAELQEKVIESVRVSLKEIGLTGQQ
eukprot:g19278.t1